MRVKMEPQPLWKPLPPLPGWGRSGQVRRLQPPPKLGVFLFVFILDNFKMTVLRALNAVSDPHVLLPVEPVFRCPSAFLLNLLSVPVLVAL